MHVSPASISLGTQGFTSRGPSYGLFKNIILVYLLQHIEGYLQRVVGLLQRIVGLLQSIVGPLQSVVGPIQHVVEHQLVNFVLCLCKL